MIDGTFDVAGAAGPTQLFEHLEPQALSHGYVFTGPAGIGKKTFARRLAQSVLCTTPKAGLLGYCGHCSGCTQVVSGTHPDLYEAEGQVKIGDRDGAGFHGEETSARDLVRQLSMHSYAGGKRVFILGDVEFTREAANALLKFFEEPPGDVLLLLTTSSASRLLPTVRSRLVEVTFAPLSDAEVAALLEREGIEPDVAARVTLPPAADATRARGLLDGEGTTRDAAIAWFFAIVTGEEADANAWATRATLDDGLDVLKTLTRDWLALRISPDAPLLAPDVAYRLETLPERDPATIVRALAALGDAERIAQSNVSPALIADLAKMALVTR
jgi:hypothetical protein